MVLKASQGRLSWRAWEYAVSMREPCPIDFHRTGLPMNSNLACRGWVCWGSHRLSVLSLEHLWFAAGVGALHWGSVDTTRQAVSSLYPFSGGSYAFLQLPWSCLQLGKRLPWVTHVSSPSLCTIKTQLPSAPHTFFLIRTLPPYFSMDS